MDSDPGPVPGQGRGRGARRRVIVGVSGSLSSLQALRVATAEAQRLGAVLHVVRVWYPPRVTGLAALMAYTPAPWLKQARESVAAAFDDALGGVPAGLDVRVRLIEGDAGVELVQVADRDNDLLVVGAGRPGRLHRLTHGTVAGYCIGHAACPVLVVPLPQLAREARRHGFFDRIPSHVPDGLLGEFAGTDAVPSDPDERPAAGRRPADAQGADDAAPAADPKQAPGGKPARRQRGPHRQSRS